MDAGLSSEFIP